MAEANYRPGDVFLSQFVWQIPDGDFIRAIFEVDVLDLDFQLDRYLVSLRALKAGRQESTTGEVRPKEALSRTYWAMVGQLIGKRTYLAFEVDDGRPVRLRLATLTQEHSFFTRFDNEKEEE